MKIPRDDGEESSSVDGAWFREFELCEFKNGRKERNGRWFRAESEDEGGPVTMEL